MLLRYFFNRDRLFTAMAFSSAMAAVLLFYRIEKTSSMFFAFLAWNLFLAWIPYIVSFVLKKSNNIPWWGKTGAFITWLLFFPNAPYILTDLLHLQQRAGIPLWFDLLLILAFAWSGLMLGLASLLNVHLFLKKLLGEMRAWMIVILLLFLCGFGTYLGRFLRWNSWDAFTDPVHILKTSFGILANPLHEPHAIGFTLIFSGLLVVSYFFFVGMLAPFRGSNEEG